MKIFPLLMVLVISVFYTSSSLAEVSSLDVEVKKNPSVKGLQDVSGVAKVGTFYVICSDEENTIQFFKRVKPGVFKQLYDFPLQDEKKVSDKKSKKRAEFDLEGIASESGYLYLIGSHSLRRLKVKKKKNSYLENLQSMREVKKEEERRVLHRLFLTDKGKVTSQVMKKDLYQTILQFPHLALFRRIPGKENGIDIEGLASHKGKLFVGFRGPVLRGNWVPILVTEFVEKDKPADLRYVNLGGLGIRGMTVVDGTFFLIGGPVGDGPGGYFLFSWNGEDCLPGKGGPGGEVRKIAEINKEKGMKPEGITLISKKGGKYTFLVVFDGAENGAPMELSVNLPSD